MSAEPKGTFDSIREAWVMKSVDFEHECVTLQFREAEWIDTCLRLAAEDELVPTREARLEAALGESKSALEAIRKCLKANNGEIGEYWTAREWLRNHGRYEDNLQELAVPLEVCEVVLLELAALLPESAEQATKGGI